MVGRIVHGIRWVVVVGATLGAAFGSGCSDDSTSGGTEAAKPAAGPSAPSPPEPSPSAIPAEPVVDTRTPGELVRAGRAVYNANCIACHSMLPAQDGALGPAVAGASIDLLEARVLRGEYPAGYIPKRPSRVMIPLPHLEPRLRELAAYLASFE